MGLSLGWVSDHLGEVITLLVIVIGNIVGYAKMGFQANEHERRIKLVEEGIRSHHADPNIHRTPDFERRFEDLQQVLTEIRHDVKQLLQEENKA